MNLGNSRRRFITWAVALAATPLAAQPSGWPARPVHILVPFPPGGGTDLVGRLIGDRLTALWGQPVVIENRPGASTMIASEAVARAAPNGETLLLTVSNHTSNPALFSRIPYDTEKDFTPITMIGRAAMVLVVKPSLPAQSLEELLALMRAQPGRLSYGSAGNGSVGHLAGELLKQMAGVDMVHVSYRGTAPAESDLVAGTIDLMFTGMLTAAPQIRTGGMRGIAVGSTNRSAVLPELPTLDEAGVRGFESSIWYGLLGPAGMPHEPVARIHQDVARVLQEPDTSAKLLSQGVEAVGSSPEQFRHQIAAEIKKFSKLARAAGVKSE